MNIRSEMRPMSPDAHDATEFILYRKILVRYQIISYYIYTYTKKLKKRNKYARKNQSWTIITKFSRLIVINIGGKRRLNRPLSEEQKKYLRALKIGEDIFTNPNAGGKLLL